MLSGEGVRVVCRVRPLNQADGGETKNDKALELDDVSVSAFRPPGRKQAKDAPGRHVNFGFHRVFGESADNNHVYKELAAPLVASFLDGGTSTAQASPAHGRALPCPVPPSPRSHSHQHAHILSRPPPRAPSTVHGSILSYGQTGSGKTHTMMGRDGMFSKGEHRGIVPRVINDIFVGVEGLSPESYDVEVRLSVLEIYNDELFDLVAPTGTRASKNKTSNTARKKKLRILESGGAGLQVAGASTVEVLDTQAALTVIDLALKRRAVVETKMNARSSRSHAVVVVTMVKRDLETETSKIGQLYCVDLAGSEKVSKTGAFGERLSEAGSINKVRIDARLPWTDAARHTVFYHSVLVKQVHLRI